MGTHAPDGNSARKTESKKEATWGNQSFWKLIPISLFLGLLIYLLLCIEMNRESCGGQHPDFYQNQVLYIKNLRGFTSLLAMRPADILRPFLSDNQKTYFFQACFFLKPGTTLQIKLHSYRVRV